MPFWHRLLTIVVLAAGIVSGYRIIVSMNNPAVKLTPMDLNLIIFFCFASALLGIIFLRKVNKAEKEEQEDQQKNRL